MLTIYEKIHELRIELARCRLTSQERKEAKAELARLQAERDGIERELDAALAALHPLP